jgi:glucosylceramidase
MRQEKMDKLRLGLILCIAPFLFQASTAHALTATDTIQAESFSGQSGTTVEACSDGGQDVTSIQNADYLSFADINFGSAAVQCFEARIASYGCGGCIEIHLDSLNGPCVGTCEVQPITGSWHTWTNKACAVMNTAGVHTVYLKFTGPGGDLFNLNWFKFHEARPIVECGWRQSTKSAKGVWKGKQTLSDASGQTPSIEILPDSQYQRVDGFGGAFNDNGAVCIDSLSALQRTAVMRELFDPISGCKFTIGRVPIGMSDFTVTRDYSLDEKLPSGGSADYTMANFTIAHDLVYNIPFVKEAMKFQPNLMLHASPWTPPTWMKNTKDWQGSVNGTTSKINKDSQTLSAYALYFRKFIQSWQKEGLPIFVVFPQNEPGWTAANHPSCSWSGTELKNFIRDYLYPDFKANAIATQLWLGTFFVSDFVNDAKPALDDTLARTIIRGCGFQREGAPAMLAATTYNPSLHWRAMETENMCYGGANTWNEAMQTFGYLNSFFNANTNFFTFWNMILNSDYNYVSWMKRAQNSLVTVNISKKTITYNPEFYSMKHYSYYIAPGAVRIKTTTANANLSAIAFKNPDGAIILEVANNAAKTISPVIKLGSKIFTPSLTDSSMNTFNLGGTEEARSWVPATETQYAPPKRLLAAAKRVEGVYDIKGRLIKVIDRAAANEKGLGFLRARIDGSGRKTAPGLYIIIDRTGKDRARKVICD